jgi:[histone H3]-trimethyl-L-lysine4 demethylase
MVIQTTRSSTGAAPKRDPGKHRRLQNRARKHIRTSPPLDLETLNLDYDPRLEVPKNKRPMGLQDAPTYWPTEREWVDPLGYIASIAEEGKKYGIVKVYIIICVQCGDGH